MFPSVSPKQDNKLPTLETCISLGCIILSCTADVHPALSVMVKLYVPALNPEKSKEPPSVIPVN